MNEPGTRASRISIAARDVSRIVRRLRSPETGLLGQGFRYAIAGGTVALVYLVLTTVLADGFGVPFQLALAIGYATALVIHFSLQRFFVWVHHEEFSLPLRAQLLRYLILAGSQYGTTAAAVAYLPSRLGLPATAVFYGWAILITAGSFVILRQGIFQAKRQGNPENG